MRDNTIWSTILTLAILGFVVPAHAQSNLLPADIFDLSEWNITVPVDKNKDKKPDTVSVKKLKKYSHPDFFYLDENNHLVFTAPNKAATTPNSTNTRSELRQMLCRKI